MRLTNSNMSTVLNTPARAIPMLNKTLRLSVFITLLAFFACGDDDNGSNPKTKADLCVMAKSANSGKPIDGTYIVAFANDQAPGGRSARAAARVLASHRLAEDKIVGEANGELLHYIMKLSADEALELKRDPSVMLVEQDRVISICACFTVIAPRLVTWNVDKVGYGDGTGKTAWIMDTGIDFDHPDLTVDQSRSRAFVDGETSADDDNGHGTHVAGIIGAKNNTIGTLGVASGATLVALKILDDHGDGRLSTALKALTYVRSNAKAGDVVNISMGLEEVSEILETEIRGVANKGIFVAIAAGNRSTTASSFSPGRTNGKNIYTVTAVDSLNHFASFSNYGNDAVDFAAPGVRIVSTYRNGQYAILSGTSMATPHVAGLLLINNGVVNSDGVAEDDPDGVADPLAHK